MTPTRFDHVIDLDEVADPAPVGARRTDDIEVRLLDGFSVVAAGELRVLPRSVERLVALVALSERPLSRSEAAAILWADASEQRAHANLRTALWRQQRTGRRIVEANTTSLRLVGTVAVDVARLRSTAQSLRDPAYPLNGTIDGLFTKELLPGWYDDWVVSERERLRLVRLQALETLGSRYARARRFALAEACFASAVSIEPLRESAQRALIRTLIDAANPGEALLRYRSYRTLLERELGVSPSAEMESLIRESLTKARAVTPA